MYHGKNKTQWEHTASMLAVISNIMCDKKEKCVKPDDLNPYVIATKTNKQDIPKADIKILKDVFIDKKFNI